MKEPGFTPQRPTQEQHREGHWSYEELKRRIVDTYTDGEGNLIPFSELPKSVDIGIMGTKTLECVRRMNEDPEHREHGMSIVYDPGNRRLLIQKDDKITVGEKREIANKQTLFRTGTGEISALAGHIHTHPTMDPFSFKDILSLLFGIKIRIRDTKIYQPMHLSILGNVDGSLSLLFAGRESIGRGDISEELIKAKYYELVKKRLETIPKKQKMGLAADYAIIDASHVAIAQLAEEFGLGYYRGNESGILRRFRVKKPAQE